MPIPTPCAAAAIYSRSYTLPQTSRSKDDLVLYGSIEFRDTSNGGGMSTATIPLRASVCGAFSPVPRARRGARTASHGLHKPEEGGRAEGVQQYARGATKKERRRLEGGSVRASATTQGFELFKLWAGILALFVRTTVFQRSPKLLWKTLVGTSRDGSPAQQRA